MTFDTDELLAIIDALELDSDCQKFNAHEAYKDGFVGDMIDHEEYSDFLSSIKRKIQKFLVKEGDYVDAST